MKCPNCSKKNPAKSKFCIYCGTDLVSRTCPQCGKKIETDAKFCIHCGARFGESARKAKAKAPAPIEKETPGLPTAKRNISGKRIPAWVWAAVAIGAVLAGVLLMSNILTPHGAEAGEETPTTEPITTVSIPTNTAAPTILLRGTWSGGRENFRITVVLDDSCELNEICGKFEIPSFPLKGDIQFVNIEGDRYQFIALNLSTGNQSEATFEYLEMKGDGSLVYHSEGPYGVGEVTLTRQ